MILIISYGFTVLHILLNIVITLKSQNLESNKIIIIIIVIIIIIIKIDLQHLPHLLSFQLWF